LKDRIAKETAEAEAKKSADSSSKTDESKDREAKSALEAAMAATLAEFAPAASATATPLPGGWFRPKNNRKFFIQEFWGKIYS
jgi:hypothetical protein